MGTPLIACLHANWVNVNLPGYHTILYNVRVCNSYITGPRFVAILLHCKSMRASARGLSQCNEMATNRGHVI